jgi:hypothetical protein
MRNSFFTLSALAATVAAHGNITSPPARVPGPAMQQACGQTAVQNVLSDGTIPLEDVFDAAPTCKSPAQIYLLPVKNPDLHPTGKLDLCRGAVFEDNKDKVQNFTAGQVISMKAAIPIPHEGPANVSIVKTATNKMLGKPLLVFASYADEKLAALPPNNTAFNVTIPANMSATDCRVAGECVLQWFWFGTSAKQTYESCVDFRMV